MPPVKNKYKKHILLLPLLICCFSKAGAQYDLGRPSLLIRAEDGLPNHYFRGLAMDADGFMWIGSYDGLARFDGTQIKTFFHQADDSSSLAHSAVASLAASPADGKIWAGTYGGLSVFDPGQGRFHSYYHIPSDSPSLISNFIEWIYIDRQNASWISSGSQVLTRYEPTTDAFVHYYPRPAEAGPAPGGPSPKERILAVCQAPGNDALLWISTNLRFFRFDKYKLQFNYPQLPLKDIGQVFPHSDGYLYLLGREGDIQVYDPAGQKIIKEVRARNGWSRA